MLISGGACILGIIITGATYNSASIAGGSYYICWGAIIFGGIYFINLANWIKYR